MPDNGNDKKPADRDYSDISYLFSGMTFGLILAFIIIVAAFVVTEPAAEDTAFKGVTAGSGIAVIAAAVAASIAALLARSASTRARARLDLEAENAALKAKLADPADA